MVNGVAQTDSGRPRQLRTIIRQERKMSRALIFSTNKTKVNAVHGASAELQGLERARNPAHDHRPVSDCLTQDAGRPGAIGQHRTTVVPWNDLGDGAMPPGATLASA